MVTLYKYSYTGIENASGAGIMAPEKVVALGETYIILKEGVDLEEVENETIVIEPVSIAERVQKNLAERFDVTKFDLSIPVRDLFRPQPGDTFIPPIPTIEGDN